MALDPYAPCPCGSGKKSKFCCLDIAPQMEKVSRLRANNQFEQAMSALEKVDATSPDRPWVLTTKAALHNDAFQFAEARDTLRRVLKTEPAHPIANALYAMAVFNLEGWPEAKPLVHRAFKACVQTRPDAIAPLAGAVADELLDGGHLMAARQHLVLALRFAVPDDQRRAFMELMELDGDTNEFYPLRGPHTLEAVAVAEELQPGYQKALKQAAVGCFEEAADTLAEVVAQAAGQSIDVPAEMLAELALLRAWDADAPRAADAFERAAALTENEGDAVDWLVAAALLQMAGHADSPPLLARQFRTDNVAATLSKFDEHPRLVRAQNEDGSEVEAAMYLVLDADEPPPYEADIALDDIARVIARVTVATGAPRYGEDDQPLPQVSVFGVHNETSDDPGELNAAVAVLTAADDTIEAADTRSEAERTLGRVSREIEAVRWEPYVPPRTMGSVRRRLTADHWVRVFDEVWPKTPLVVLGGRTVDEVQGGLAEADDEQAAEDRRRLAASVQLLDAICDTHRMRCPVDLMVKHYDLPELPAVPVTPELPINTLTVPQLMRVPREDLSDEQYGLLLQRALLVGHSRFLDEALGEAIDRGLSLDGIIEPERAYVALADSAANAADLPRAIEWISRGIASMGEDPATFQARVSMKMTELGLRAGQPDDAETTTLLKELWEEYATKVPELKPMLQQFVADFGIDPPWSTIATPGDDSGSLWTGEAEPATGGSSGAIWTPGS